LHTVLQEDSRSRSDSRWRWHFRVGTSDVSHIVDVEAADVRKEVLVGEGVVRCTPEEGMEKV
jgi:hypothetical protein